MSPHYFERSTEDGDNSTIRLTPLELPSLVVGKSGVAIQTLPPVARFWDKLGLSPRSGPKDVVAFILFEDKGQHRFSEVEDLLYRLSIVYKVS